MPKLTEYELERQANIARNKALLESLNIKEAAASLATKETSEKAKPIQPAKKFKREKPEPLAPRRQSLRLRKEVIDPNETPSKKRKREAEVKAQIQKEEKERLEAEERAREAKKPRHQDLDINALVESGEFSEKELSGVIDTLNSITTITQPKQIGTSSAFVYDEISQENKEVLSLQERLRDMKVVSRAKVTQDRIYSAVYHPEKSKDLIFFGDKHGQLGIWDAQAPSDEVEDEDGDVRAPEEREGGKYWRLQPHWPATSRSSISSIKLDPIDSHSVFTSAYDCSVRNLSFVTGISREIFSMEGVLLTSIDLPPTGNEMWITDGEGGLTHLDTREDKSKARRWLLSEQKVGCVSVNPTDPSILLLASNDRTVKFWDSRKLQKMPLNMFGSYPSTIDWDNIQKYSSSKNGHGTLLTQMQHGKSVSSAYWDPRGRSIVSTCYDDKLRIWDVGKDFREKADPQDLRPIRSIRHNCQTGRWLTVLKAQWNPNPDVYPHFTVGNMEHSLDIFTCKGELLTQLSDRQRITAVQAVTCSHPGIVERAASGNASGRCVLWAPNAKE